MKLIPRHVRLRGAPIPKAAPPVESKALTLPISQFWLDGNPLYVANEDRPLSGMATYAISALSYILADFRATKLVEAPLWIKDETEDGEETWLTGSHPLEALLEQPNPDMDADDFWRLVSLYLDLPGGGECLLVKNRGRAGLVESLYPFARGEFTVKPAGGRLYGQFEVTMLGGERRTFGPDDVIYLRETDPRGPHSAMSPGDAALADLNLSEQQRQAVRAMFRHAIMPGSVTSVKENLAEDAYNRWREQVQANYGGAQNAGKHLLVEGAATVEFLKSSLKELDFGPLSDRLESVICAAYKVHPILVGLHAGSTMNGGLSDSLGPAQELFYDLCALPRWKRIGNKLTQGLLREAEPTNLRRYIRFDTTQVRALQEDLTEKVDQAAKATWWTTNEKREHTGKEATSEPVDDDLQRAPAPGEAEAEDDEPRLELVKGRTEHKAWTPALIEKAWHEFDQKAASHDDRYEAAARRLFESERVAVVRMIRDAIPAGISGKAGGVPTFPAPSDDPEVPDLSVELAAPYLEMTAIQVAAEYAVGGGFHEKWVRRFTQLIEGTVRMGMGDMGAPFPIGLPDPDVLVAIERRAMELATLVGEETAKRITEILLETRANGQSMGKVVKAIREAFDDMTPTRARRIARTETIGALNEGRQQGAKKKGMRSKRWGSQKVGDVRLNHVAWDNDGWVPMEYAYPGKKGGMMHPGDKNGGAGEVVNCRCFMLYDDRTPDEIREDGDDE